VGLATLAGAAVTGAVRVLDGADALLVLLGISILIAELFPVEMPDEDGEVSFSTTFAFAILLTDGIAAVVLVHAIALAIAETIRRRPFERLVFNVSQYAICWTVAGGLLALLTGDLPDENGLQYLEGGSTVPALVISAAAFLLLNLALASTPPALARGVPPLSVMRADLRFHTWSTVVLIVLAPVILVAADYSLWLFPLLGVPLVAIQFGSRQAVINEHRARHDSLTGLPNRIHLTRALREAVDRAGADGIGVLILGLDRFREINETLGHRRGDVVLCEAGRRLNALARPGDVVARLGGDEFALMLNPVGGPGEAAVLADAAIASLERPVSIGGVELDIGARVGIACYPEHGRSVDALLRHADVALDKAKGGRDAKVIYRHDFDEHGLERLALLAELRRAIDEGGLQLHFQPQVELATGALRGVEALVRWHHPQRGLLSPRDFIGPAEHTGVIHPLTMWVIDEALDQADRWLAAGVELTVAVNLSARSITGDLPRRIAERLAGRRSARALELEITETVDVADADEALAVLHELTGLGIRLSVDDFGTGFASLAYLKRLPVSAIKIDRSFVTEMEHDESDRAIVRSTIDLARHLKMLVIAEGVETVTALEELRELGCHLAQGYVISPPLTADALDRWRAAQGVPSAVEPVFREGAPWHD
jgi:diguanylate cyclase (GGDEF)-like protein